MGQGLDFLHVCTEGCPRVQNAVVSEIGKQALGLGRSPEDPASLNLAGIADAIKSKFADPLGFEYKTECDGPRPDGSCGRGMKSTGGV